MIIRGCGTRKKGGLYVMSELNEEGGGKPIEDFLIDPIIPALDQKPFRSPQFFQTKDKIWHILIWVGKQFYPTPIHFIEEAGLFGVSRRIPKHAPLYLLTPKKSKMLFIHPKAFIKNANAIFNKSQYKCPKNKTHKETETCIGMHYALYAAQNNDNVLRINEYYNVPIREKIPQQDAILQIANKIENKKIQYGPGIFMIVPITSIHYIPNNNESDKEVIEKLKTYKVPSFLSTADYSKKEKIN